MSDAFHLAASRPWLIQRESLETILAVAQRAGDPQALQSRLGRPLDNTRRVTMRDGVAVIPATGPMFRYANLFTEISGATSTQVLATDIQAALDNPYVKAIVLELNTPGGEASGIGELADMIYAARGSKRIVGYVGDLAASAGYWFGSACDELVIAETGMVGSIGVVMSYLDTSERDAKAGVRTLEIVSSQSPDKRLDPKTDEGRAKVQSIVDSLAEVFVGAVARNRGVPVDTVLSDFGRGGVLLGAEAVKAGMADRIGSLEAVITELAGSASAPKRKTPMSNTNGQVTVSTTADLRSALAAGHTADQIVIADNSSAIAAARAEGEAAGRAAATEEAVKAERTRVLHLQSLSRSGFEAELATAIDNATSPEAFALALLRAAQDRGITLDAVRRDAPTAAGHARPGDASAKAAPARLSSSDIFARRRAATSTSK
ncbi:MULTISPECIES: S49 family peptidase [unclassified Xanthomonas]|uniref:S49 family peptidase n=1 Tax=unclassified Xanthomonas TaxID=2643310 RepID=UPI002A7F09FA|nr:MULTISPECIES: S49 family peptidase [unclassified Xanthomonas]MDY4296822.1 S49 family peptidase [Xanthomonas sp. LF02-5]MDY4358419.1 S49 family peptidase [Xanthomonas sp. LF04-12]